jgi:ribonuclease D
VSPSDPVKDGARVTSWVRTPDELRRLVSDLDGCGAIAIDTEADSLHHYSAKVCLIQLATDRGLACLIDPLELTDLSPLGPVLADPRVVKVLHGADYDVTLLKRDFGFGFENLFDTMIAARFLGLAEIGLQALARNELGVTLSKASQKDDWSRRPLTPKQETYALADVEFLFGIRSRLLQRLEALGRLEWALEECRCVTELPPARRERDPEAYLKIKGASRLSRRSLAVLRELHAWREAVAAAADKPPFRILRNETLLALASHPPLTKTDLARAPGVGRRLGSHGAEIVEAAGRGLELPPEDLPSFPRRERPVRSPATRQRGAALKAWREQEAKRLGLDVSVVLPQRLVDRVAATTARDLAGLEPIEGLRRWRIEALGASLVAALKADPA